MTKQGEYKVIITSEYFEHEVDNFQHLNRAMEQVKLLEAIAHMFDQIQHAEAPNFRAHVIDANTRYHSDGSKGIIY